MRRLLKIIDNLARLIAVIDIGKQISEHLASKKSNQQHKKKKRNRLISQRLRFLVVIPTGLPHLKCRHFDRFLIFRYFQS